MAAVSDVAVSCLPLLLGGLAPTFLLQLYGGHRDVAVAVDTGLTRFDTDTSSPLPPSPTLFWRGGEVAVPVGCDRMAGTYTILDGVQEH